jgi:CheY-like chemotaxis protein
VSEQSDEQPNLTDQLEVAVRDVLAHLYDQGYLLGHPLLARLSSSGEASPALALQRLRSLLLRAIEGLRPSTEEEAGDKSWRPYEAIYQRYVLGKELEQLAQEMALSTRQVQREQRRGIAAITAVLAGQLGTSSDPAEPTDVALLREVTRAASASGSLDCVEQTQRALATASTMLAAHDIVLHTHLGRAPLPAAGDAAVFRQMLLSTLSLMARTRPGSELSVTAESGSRCAVRCTITTDQGAGDIVPVELPAELDTLARSQGVQITQRVDAGRWMVELYLPTAARLPLVALVEDNQDLVALLQRYLGSRGYQLVAIDDSPDAAERVATLAPDVIVLDVMMRNVDGWELLQRLKADPRLQQVPVVMCSVLNEPDLATCLGAEAYLRKPIRPVQFLECLERLLAR